MILILASVRVLVYIFGAADGDFCLLLRSQTVDTQSDDGEVCLNTSCTRARNVHANKLYQYRVGKYYIFYEK